MKRTIEIKSAELLIYGSELTDKIQDYLSKTPLLINAGRAFTKVVKMSDNRCVFIHHTHKSVIVEKV